MNLLSIIHFVSGVMPALASLVQVAEVLIPQSGQGAQKLNLVLNTVQGAMSAAQAANDQFEQLKPALTGAVNNIVSAYKLSGGIPQPAQMVAAPAVKPENGA